LEPAPGAVAFQGVLTESWQEAFSMRRRCRLGSAIGPWHIQRGCKGTEPGPMRHTMDAGFHLDRALGLARGKNLLAAACLALALGGCETVSNMGSQSVAEVDTVSAADTSVNIGSLSEVISRNPNDPNAYNTRGAAYARSGRLSDAI